MTDVLDMITERDSYDPIAVGARISALRELHGLTKSQLADMIGLDPSSQTKMEKGSKPLLPVYAVRVSEIFGVTLDFLYLGDLSGVRFDIAAQLRELAKRKPGE